MIRDVHHVSIYGRDLSALQRFLAKHFGMEPIHLEHAEHSVTTSADQSASGTQTPKVAIFRVGGSLLEIMQPRVRYGVHYDRLRRNGGQASVSHIAWTVVDISARLRELVRRGAELDMWDKGEPTYSSHGGYLVINLFADEAVRGVKFQFAEDLSDEQVDAIEEHRVKPKYHAAVPANHRWLAKPAADGRLTHVHHVCYQLWGLDYFLDYMKTVFEVRPFCRQDRTELSFRGASFRFGRAIAQFEEPTKFGDRSANFALSFGTHSGVAGGGTSHVGWGVGDLDKTISELQSAGVKFAQPEAVRSLHGDYRFIDTLPDQSGGIAFQLCQDL